MKGRVGLEGTHFNAYRVGVNPWTHLYLANHKLSSILENGPELEVRSDDSLPQF